MTEKRSPDRARLNLLRDLAANTNRAAASGTPDLDRFRAELELSGWAEDLAEARRTIERRIGVAADPVTKGKPEHPVSAPRSAPSEPVANPEPSAPHGPGCPLPAQVGLGRTADRLARRMSRAWRASLRSTLPAFLQALAYEEFPRGDGESRRSRGEPLCGMPRNRSHVRIAPSSEVSGG
jgi:hypothetical protein